MALKTDYKDYIPPSGERKYKITANSDGSSSIEDITQYQQIGDTWGAEDINQITKTLNGRSYGNEVDTGLTWLDGKKIYRKTAIIGPNDYATTTGKDSQEQTVYTVSKAGFITGVSMIIRMDVAITHENWFMPLGAKRNGSSDYGGCTFAGVTNGTVDWTAEIGLRNPADGPSSFIVICEYTKI
jgi:hypothetical protein